MILLALAIAASAIILGAYLWWRVPAWESALVTVLTLFGVGAASVQMLGLPRPVGSDVLASFEDVPVLGHDLKDGEAIYLWVRRNEPIAYRLPWDIATAERLHKAAQEAAENKTELQARRAASGEWVFHPKPAEALPPKY
jgi:hypothetical protein